MSSPTSQRASGMLSALLLVICLAALAGPASAAADGPCTDVEIVGLRGSSEGYLGSEHGMGSLLGPVADTIATQLSGEVTFSAYGIPYRAVDAVSGVLSGDYFDSKQEGGEMLHDYLLQRAIDCPATKFVVMGYSQGAHAAGDELALEGSFLTDRIAAFVMFGDPRFNPEASYVWGSYDSRDHGLAGARSLSDFAGWSTRVFSFCRHNDQICQGFGYKHGTAEHDQSKYVSDYADLVAGLVRRRLGLTQLPRVPLDLAFVLDSTGSMWSSIDEVREAVSSIAAKLHEKDSDFRVGLVDYKDTDQGDPYAAQLDLDMTQSLDDFTTALDGLSAYGGGDYPEAVYSGLMRAFTGMSWRGRSRKAVILMGDAPAKDPEPVTGYTEASVLAAAHAVPTVESLLGGDENLPPVTATEEPLTDEAAVYPLAVGSGPLASFEPLADGTGGSLFMASGSSTVADQVVEAVSAATSPVEVVLSSVTPARPGDEVSFTAGASYAGGEIESYAWDFDGDGSIDETTGGGHVTHVYPFPLDGSAEVIATADDGHQGTASTPVEISEDAPLPATAPTQVQATSPGFNSLHISWQPPQDLGGGNLAGYQLFVKNGATGALKAAGGLAPSVLHLDLEGLPAGAYSATVAALTEAGQGAEASGSALVAAPPTAPIGTGPSHPAASSPPEAAIGRKRSPRKCKRGFRRRTVHGKSRCVKRGHGRHAGNGGR